MPDIFQQYAEAWEAYFAGWLQSQGKTVEDLGPAWAGNGGENRLKRDFEKWYTTWIIRRQPVKGTFHI